MPPTKLGTLVVVVLKGRNLPNPSLYKQSPYILARVGGGGKRTKIDVKGGQHPVWDEDLHFEIYPQDRDQPRVLRLTCFVEGRGRIDESIGEGELSIDDVFKHGEFDGWVPLSLNGMQRGEVYLELTFFLNAQALGRRPSKLSPAERLHRPSPPPSPSSSAARPSSPHSNSSSPGRAPLGLPPRVGSPSPASGRNSPLSLPQRQQPAPPPGSNVGLGTAAYSGPQPVNTAPARPKPANGGAPAIPEYYDPFQNTAAPSYPPANGARPTTFGGADMAGIGSAGFSVPASLRPGPGLGGSNAIPYLDPPSRPTAAAVSSIPTAPSYVQPPQPQSQAQPPALPPRHRQDPPVSSTPFQTTQSPPLRESEALAAQRLAWEERDRRKKQEEEDEAFARQLMLEEEENER